MTNLYRQNKSRKPLLFATAIVVLVFVADALSGGSVRGIVRVGAARAWVAASQLMRPLSESGLFASRRALEAENTSLKQQLLTLQSRIADADALQNENESLRALVHLTLSGQGITAPVVSSFTSSPYGTFVIGAGSEDGITNGSLVLSGGSIGGFVIGRVSDPDKHIALVTQLFAPNASVEATVHGVGIVATGSGGGNARAVVPHNAPIVNGDVVVSAGLGGRLIGIVGGVEEDTTGTNRTVYIGLPIDFAALQFVYVIPSRQ